MTGHGATHFVSVVDNDFLPGSLTIAPGDTVSWTNQGSDHHTVSAEDGSFNEIVDSEVTFTHTFTTAGRFPYFCQLHGAPGGVGMAGSIRVADTSQNVAPVQPQNITPANGATGVSTSPSLTASAFADANADDLHAASQWVVRVAGTSEIFFDSEETENHRTSIILSGLAGGTTYAWQVRYKDDIGAWSEYSAPTEFSTVAILGNGTGLAATYGAYNRARDRFVSKTTHVDAAVDFDWGVKPANRSTPADNFFVRWEGTVVPEFSEPYRFRFRADGGVRLWINEQLIVDDWAVWKFPIYRSGRVTLQAGVPATIRLEYFDTTGKASCSLRWSSPSQPIVVIPQARLFPPTE